MTMKINKWLNIIVGLSIIFCFLSVAASATEIERKIGQFEIYDWQTKSIAAFRGTKEPSIISRKIKKEVIEVNKSGFKIKTTCLQAETSGYGASKKADDNLLATIGYDTYSKTNDGWIHKGTIISPDRDPQSYSGIFEPQDPNNPSCIVHKINKIYTSSKTTNGLNIKTETKYVGDEDYAGHNCKVFIIKTIYKGKHTDSASEARYLKDENMGLFWYYKNKHTHNSPGDKHYMETEHTMKLIELHH